MKMRSLYEISNEYRIILEKIYENEEIDAVDMDILNEASGDLNNKIINISYLIKNMQSEQDSIEKAIKSMTKRALRIEKKITHLLDYIKANMQACNIKLVKGVEFDVKLKQNPKKLYISPDAIVPDDYVTEKVIKKIDKITLLQHVKNGLFVKGVELINGFTVKIK